MAQQCLDRELREHLVGHACDLLRTVRKELVWGSYLDRDGWMECYGPTDA
eukprot:COSAG06_NODE_728_length_12746_cov_13.586068_12_plen_50_part_00